MATPRLVGVVGMGLIGGSLARRLVGRGTAVVAWNHRPHPYEQAERDGIRCVATLADLVEAAPDVIVLCNPLKAMPAILAELRPLLDAAPGITLTDVGSVKGMVRDQVEAAGLGERYVGAHPMAGNELSGWTAADPHLYDDALWAITVTDHTDFDRFSAVARLIVDGVGDRLIVLDDDTHDKAAAMISHMPHVVATALINELTDDANRNIAAALAAGSWRDMTRVALTDPDRTRAMVEEDAENVETLLRHMADRLTTVADLLHDERTGVNGDGEAVDVAAWTAMRAFFAEGQPFRDYKARQKAIAGRTASTETDSADMPRYEEREIGFSPDRWQSDLLASARRGEHIVAFEDAYKVRVQRRSAL
ncbi:prephenate dehydrogenase/arogenate dehydrogenase family protein [Bifidobacterium sp. MA2]|uniref:Prephenate dehydrogenase/arogenate dehydrogenase family protein n=1 Tax=Bifidobacterium santillanense TaxID=2809028 RepID=A0ABS5UMS0_9BIFI|nr:prephenate dehydrogenase/arogenate dehydrogenase family protein [Bifidobacterium santillanense]MBT1172168.1 prephenate dehydrogenase/arogenate dehydrogenase family protein [Bifidobacterium santillanense]